MLISQRPFGLTDLSQQPLPGPSIPGVELLATYQLAPQGGPAPGTWTANLIELDAPVSFGKYFQFLFQISGLGFSTTANPTLDIRKNYRATPGITRPAQYWAPSATTTINYFNPAATQGQMALTTNIFDTNQYMRDAEFYFTQSGINYNIRLGTNSTLNTAGIWFGIQPFAFGANPSSEAYGYNDIPGIKLGVSAGTFTVPYNASGGFTNTSFDVECRIFGWRRA